MIKLKHFLGYSFLLSAVATAAQAQFDTPIETIDSNIEVIDENGNPTEVPATQYIIQYKSNKKSAMTSKISKMNGEIIRSIHSSG